MLGKKCLICIPHEPTILAVIGLDDFAINAITNLFFHGRLKIPEMYSEPNQTSKMELFAKIVNG